MARRVRIEYPGAVYHVMSRGDKGEKIFRDAGDYDLFQKGMDEVCARTGWRVHAWVLMGNHFHWLLETPGGNLVSGMKWFLGAYSQWFNARHGQRGHVFQGRYKAVVIQSDDPKYFETVSTYIHLNPARAGLLKKRERGLEQYEWSSYGQYVSGRRKRPVWLITDRVLGNLSLKDDTAGRRRYARHLEEQIGRWRTAAGKREFRALWSGIRHGWYVGDAAFEEKLLGIVAGVVEDNNRRSYGGDGVQRYDEHQAETLICKGLKRLRMSKAELLTLPKGDPRKCALAALAHSQTLASHRWLADYLQMGHSQNMTHYIQSGRTPSNPFYRKLRSLCT